MAARFLKALDATAPGWTFQTFDDSKAARPELARVLHGSPTGHAPELTRLQLEGAGVFATINETDLCGRKAENIKRVRAFFVDLDGAPLKPVLKWLRPHILVESSPSRWHAYWLVSDCPLYAFTGIQKLLIASFKADGAVHDLPRVMRLPGFWHQKSEAFQTRLRRVRDVPPFTLAEFREHLKRRPVPETGEVSEEKPVPPFNRADYAGLEHFLVQEDSERRLADVARYLREVAKIPVTGVSGNAHVHDAAAMCYDSGVTLAATERLMWEHFNPRGVDKTGSPDPWTDPEDKTWTTPLHSGFATPAGKGRPPGTKSIEVREARQGVATAEDFAGAEPLDGTHGAQTARPAGASPLVRRIIRPGEERPAVRWAIKEMLPSTGAAMIVAPPGAGKSTALLDLSAHLSRGDAWFGRKVTEPRATVILAFEGAGSIGHRLDALQRPGEGPLAIEVWDVAGVSPTGLATLAPMLAEADARFRESHGVGVGLVAVDTLSASGLMTEENSNAEAAAAVRSVSALAGTVGALGLLNHHPPKNGRGPRGGGAFLGNVDTLLWIEREDKAEERELILDKSRDGREGSLGRFKLRTVELGFDADGDPITACTVERTGEGPVPSSKAPPKWLEHLLDAFEHVDEELKLRLGGQVCIPENRAREIFNERVRDHFKSGGQRKAWSDALKFATSTGQLRLAERAPHCWILNRRPGIWSDAEDEE